MTLEERQLIGTMAATLGAQEESVRVRLLTGDATSETQVEAATRAVQGARVILKVIDQIPD